MSWFKVDDKLHDHRKARAAGSAAMGVWLLAGSWAADNLTDGFIPATILPRWGRPRDASRLVEVGLWHADEQDGEAGWRFHEWEERQPTRAQKLAEREAKSQAGRIGGLRSGRSRREAEPKQPASLQVELPSRPDPSRPKVVSTGRKSGRPTGWEPNENHIGFASANGIDLTQQASKFADYHDSKGSKFVDWDAAFRNWLKNAVEFAAERNGNQQPTQPTRPRRVACQCSTSEPHRQHDWTHGPNHFVCAGVAA